jgi:biotin operon repressor
MDGILLAWFHGRPKIQEGVMEKRYRVTLTESERVDLLKLVSVGKAAARKIVRARILLLADQAEGGSAKSDPEIVESLGCGRASVERVRQQFVEDGLEAVLNPSRADGCTSERWMAKRRRT